ncbi:hypothetical protein GOV12_04120 [Candidatus Pacearchaeota archaeon]|nr:hypothetical protein [Candidatus Pacearchaeota archaeon]
MAYNYLIPSWFFGLDFIFELAFAIITLIVGLYAFKVFKLSGQHKIKLFGISFIFFSISYFIQSFINYAIISKLGENICNVIKLESVNILNLLGIYVHIFFFILGLVTLVYMTLNIKSAKTYTMILFITFFSLFISLNKIYLFYILSSLMLIYIVVHYFNNYSKNKQRSSLLVLIAFIFLLFGHIHFIFSVNHTIFYTIAHFLELSSYVLILINLIWVLKK